VTAVLFDLDGTLVDSLPGIAAGINAVLGTAYSRDEIRAHVGPPVHDTFAALTGRDDLEDLVAEYRGVYAELMVEGTEVIDGIVPALSELRADGFTLAVATAKAQPLAVGLLDGLGLSRFFAAVCGPVPPAHDDKTTTIARAVRELGSPSGAVMVGDRHHDIEGAHANGLRTIGVTWGFGAREELGDADVIIDSPAALRAACAAPA
jgi:phosphoglycolate phosphatase-like HAD superfamily hydrolase